jgi:hypothetical protein
MATAVTRTARVLLALLPAAAGLTFLVLALRAP